MLAAGGVSRPMSMEETRQAEPKTEEKEAGVDNEQKKVDRGEPEPAASKPVGQQKRRRRRDKRGKTKA